MNSKQVLNHLRVTRATLTKYVKEGKVKVKKLHNGRYDYDSNSVFNLKTAGHNRSNVIYCRVSTSNQKPDLLNQQNVVELFCQNNGLIVHKIINDVSSGMNLQRKGFQELFDLVILHKVDKVIITYRDRLTRLHFEFVEKLFKEFGTEIVVLNEIDNTKTAEQEFFEELVSMIHSFSMKMYSKRRKQKLELVAKDLKLECEVDA
jgi:putative resolvase